MDFSNVRSQWVDRNSLERDDDPCCILDSSLRFVYCNPAWDVFGLENAGTGSSTGEALAGRYIGDFLSEVVKDFYVSHFSNILEGKGVWHHRYYCSSPQERRVFQLDAASMPDVDSELLLCHTPLIRSGHIDRAVSPRPVHYQSGYFVRMCVHCRRTARSDDGIWDWVPDFVGAPPKNRLDALCTECLLYYETGVWTWD